MDLARDLENIERAKSVLTPEILGSIIDLTILKPDTTFEEIQKLCRDTHMIGAQICIQGSRVDDAFSYIEKEGLNGIRAIAAVVSFPHGADRTEDKVATVRNLIATQKVEEIDIVANIGFLKDGNLRAYEQDLLEVARAIRNFDVQRGKKVALKIIQENCILNDEEKKSAARIAGEVAKQTRIVVFAKTSTGFGTNGALVSDISLMRREIAPYRQYPDVRIGLKAAGGISTLSEAIAMMLAADCFDKKIRLRFDAETMRSYFRLGCSKGVKLVRELEAFHNNKKSPP